MKWMAAFVAGLAVAAPVLAQEGRLQQVREAVDHKPDDTSSNDRSDSSSDSDSSSGDGDSLAGELFIYAFLAPFALPHAILEDDFSLDTFFPRFPYDNGQPGYLTAQSNGSGVRRGWAGRVSVENGNDFDGLNRTGAQFLLETTTRFGVQGRFDYFRERLDCGCTDNLSLGSTELTYRFAQHPNMQMSAGLGLNVLDDRFRTHYGFNFTYGADIFPVKPLVVSLSMDAGNVGHAGLFRARGTVGVLYRGLELFTGYDYLNIGGVDLQGPLAGLRLWF